MSWLRLVYWCLGILVGGALFFILESLLNRKHKWWGFLIEAAFNTALGIVCSYLFMAVEKPIIIRIGFVLGMSSMFLFPLAVYDFIMMIIYLFPKANVRLLPRILILLTLTIGYGTYGTLNSQIISRHEITYTSEKLTKDHTIVFLADLHYGVTQFDSVVDGALEAIKNDNPEMIILGGDIVDDYTSKRKMEEIFQKIGSLGIPTYYIYGNHDRQTYELITNPLYTPDELETAIESNGIKILCDSFDLIGDDIALMGREVYNEDSRKKVEDLPAVPDGRYLLFVDHSPYFVDEAKALAPDLQLSGHTHAGQLFPLGPLYVPFCPLRSRRL